MYCYATCSNQLHSAQEWTKCPASTDTCCLHKFIECSDLQMCSSLQFTEQIKPFFDFGETWILKVVDVTNAVKNLIAMNLRKQLASGWNIVWQIEPSKIGWQKYDAHWILVNICWNMHIPILSILTNLIWIPHHIKIYLFSLNSSPKIRKMVTTCNDNLQQLYQLSLKT